MGLGQSTVDIDIENVRVKYKIADVNCKKLAFNGQIGQRQDNYYIQAIMYDKARNYYKWIIIQDKDDNGNFCHIPIIIVIDNNNNTNNSYIESDITSIINFMNKTSWLEKLN